jgi:RHS repeat-associated protein
MAWLAAFTMPERLLREGLGKFVRACGTATDYLYTSQRNEAEIGLDFYVSRFYDPYLNHWTQPDTIVPDQADPLSWDRYAYVLNNPVKYTDPSGHCPWCIVIGAIAGAAVGYGSQVYSNYQNGVTGADAWLTNISGEVIAGSTLIGATIGLGVGVVSVVAGGGAVTSGGIAAGTGGTATAANTACGGDLCTDETQKVTTSLSASLHTANQVTSYSTTGIQPYYPPRLGFNGLPQVTTLLPGEVVDRYGSTFGSFLSPAGTPLWARSLPPGVEKLTLNTYQVMKPIENVLSGTVSPYFGQIGGGMQYYIGTPYGQNVQSLINSGHLLQIIQ